MLGFCLEKGNLKLRLKFLRVVVLVDIKDCLIKLFYFFFGEKLELGARFRRKLIVNVFIFSRGR